MAIGQKGGESIPNRISQYSQIKNKKFSTQLPITINTRLENKKKLKIKN
jgi:hypothetical protein